jgi:hypothetical protein
MIGIYIAMEIMTLYPASNFEYRKHLRAMVYVYEKPQRTFELLDIKIYSPEEQPEIMPLIINFNACGRGELITGTDILTKQE